MSDDLVTAGKRPLFTPSRIVSVIALLILVPLAAVPSVMFDDWRIGVVVCFTYLVGYCKCVLHLIARQIETNVQEKIDADSTPRA